MTLPIVLAEYYPLDADQGATWEPPAMTWLIDKQDGAGYVPVDLTGCTAVFEIRPTPPDVTVPPLVRISTTASSQGLITLGGTAGTMALVIYASVMGSLSAPGTDFDGDYELKLIDQDGITIVSLLKGCFNVRASVAHYGT